ncbi:WD repeat domain-containing protein 83-like [Neltuma alba]|uniref:WD repeat domain-containing protein 83-like n=1 Tax=Neltuma alba TaxID=207710 RepID=UPI0010A37B0E|nr:WD repeat domain-containing protein 83-like [Prosopis alba]
MFLKSMYEYSSSLDDERKLKTDNSKLCSCGGDRQIFYWDVATGRVIRKFRGHDGEVNAVKLNKHASVVVSAGYDQSLRALDCRSHSTPSRFSDTPTPMWIENFWHLPVGYDEYLIGSSQSRAIYE